MNHPVAGKDPDPAVIHFNRKMDDHLPLGLFEHLQYPFIHLEISAGYFHLLLGDLERI
jgi:hypothetical protein